SFAATPAFIAERQETLLRFTLAFYAGQQWISGHSADDIAEQASKQLPGVALEVIVPGVERYLAQGTWAKDPLLRPEGFYRLQDMLREGGLIRGQHRYEDQVTVAFAQAVMK